MKKEIKTNVLVIGNSAAAIGAAHTFKNSKYKGKVTFLSKEKYSSYSRPFIVYYAGGKVEKERIFYKNPDYLSSIGFEEYLDTEITELDLKNHVAVAKNKRFYFENLIIASGSKPIVPSIPGLDLENVMYFMSLKDAETLREKAKNIKSAVVIGGGLIGLKAIEALHLMGKKVYVVDIADYLMSRVLDEKSAILIQEEMEKLDTEIYTNTGVEEIYGSGKVEGVKLTNGKKIATDLVIVSIGVRPALDFMNASEFIEVDRNMRTSYEGIYAAGDVVASYNILLNKNEPNPVWPAAYNEGLVAAKSIMGESVEYRGSFPQNVLEFNNYPVISYGIPKKQSEGDIELINLDENRKYYRKAIVRDNRLMGIVLAGKIDRAGIYKGIMENGLDVSSFSERLIDFDFDYKDLPKEYFYQMFYRVSS